MKICKCQACDAKFENIKTEQTNAVCEHCHATTKIEDSQAPISKSQSVQITNKGKLTEAGKEQIKQLFCELNVQRTHLFLEHIPIKKLDRFKKLFKTDFTDNEEVIFLHDSSSFMQWFGKDGLLFTTKGLYETDSARLYWKFFAIRDIDLVTTDDSSIGFDIHYTKCSIYNKKSIVEIENNKSWCSTTDEPQLWQMLSSIVDLLKKDDG